MLKEQEFLIVDLGLLDRTVLNEIFSGVEGPISVRQILYVIFWSEQILGGGFVGNYCPQTK